MMELKQDYSELREIYEFEKKALTKHKDKINFVITHGNCHDGFMSATVVYKWLRESGVEMDDVTFYQAYHGMDFSYLVEMIRDKYVLICDFSFKKDLFDQMIESTRGNILILDHHKTAQKELQNIESKYVTFDMNHCGAFLTYTFMYGFEEIPEAILYVEDNDLWNKRLLEGNEFTSFLNSRPLEFESYMKLFNWSYLHEIVLPNGREMVKHNNALIEKLSHRTKCKLVKINITPTKEDKAPSDNSDKTRNKYYFVACLESNGFYHSELGNYLLTRYPNSNFSMIYYKNPIMDATSISFRSLNERTDVSEIAKLSGGGGHRNSAGTFINSLMNYPPGTELVDDEFAYDLLNKVYIKQMRKFNFVVLNSPILQEIFCHYLMQERNNKQEALYCLRNKLKDNDLDEIYHGAIVWDFDGNHINGYLKFLPNQHVNLSALDNYSSSVKFECVDIDLYKFSFPIDAQLDGWDVITSILVT